MTDKCPECGRPKARTWQDMMNGACPKFYAIRDEEAEGDCMSKAADKAAFRDEQEYEAEKRDKEKAVKENQLLVKIEELEWRLQQVEERQRFT